MLQGIHLVGQARFVLGEVKSIYLVERRTRAFETPNVEASVCGTLVMASDLPLFAVQSCENDMPGDTGGWTIYGNRGTVRSTAAGIEWFDGGEVSDKGRDRRWIAPEPPDRLTPYAREIASFKRYIEGAGEPTDGTSELRSLAVVEAGYESIKTGRPVVIRDRYPALFEA